MIDDDEDWVVRMCEFLDRWSSGKRAAVVFGTLAVCTSIPWVYGAAQRDYEGAVAAKHALDAHLQWLNKMPDAEKKHWPTTSVCRPSTGARSCAAYGYVASYIEFLPNGDVACHETP